MRVLAEASAPSNIALIKYMGKTSGQTNHPVNASLSYTLENLRSFVQIRESDNDCWAPLQGFTPLQLSAQGQEKFLRFFSRLKERWSIPGSFALASANNFPSDCGLASSASSFAALTLATYRLAQNFHPQLKLTPEELSRISRLGSGSSCRSFFSPWSVWREEGAEKVNLSLPLEHAVVIVAEEKKNVSSSEAHLRVTSSRLFSGRPGRAEGRLNALLEALQSGNWRQSFELCWSEFWDMHALFETSLPSFGYMQPASLAVLAQARDLWRESGDGPLVTMDAGPNVHLLLRSDQIPTVDLWFKDFKLLKSWGAASASV